MGRAPFTSLGGAVTADRMSKAREWAEAHPEFGFDRKYTLLPPNRREDTGEALVDQTPNKDRDRKVSYNFENERDMDTTIYQPTRRRHGPKDDLTPEGGVQVQNRDQLLPYNTGIFFDQEQVPEDRDFYHAWTYLEPKYQAVLDMRVVAGMSFGEIAAELGVAESAVKVPRGRYPMALKTWKRVVFEHYFHGTPDECPDGPYGVTVDDIPAFERAEV